MRKKNGTEHLAEVLVKVRNEAGFHMRAVTLFVQAVSQFPCRVTVEKNGEVVDGRSIISLMALGVEKGSCLKVTATGNRAQEAIEKLQELIESGFGEE
jgi:phosphocarrier protein